MPKLVAVSRERHAGKKWLRSKTYSFASTNSLVPIVGAELAQATLSMPLAFLEEERRFILVAVLSLVPGRNMMVAPDGRWLGRYIPARLRGYPFAIVSKPPTGEAILCVDSESGLVQEGGSGGEDFFDRDGNLSAPLKQIVDFLGQLEHNLKFTETAVSALAEAGVIQPWPIKLKSEQADKTLAGLHRVDEAALKALTDEAFLKVHKAAALPIAYAQMLSTAQFNLFQPLARLQAQLAPAPAAMLPESLDSLFGISSDDTIKFDEFIGGEQGSRDRH
jgi:hypothetical protein